MTQKIWRHVSLLQATSQSGKLPIETESYAVIVTGHADRRLLDQGILNFCGALPIYNTELVGTKPSTDGATSKFKFILRFDFESM